VTLKPRTWAPLGTVCTKRAMFTCVDAIAFLLTSLLTSLLPCLVCNHSVANEVRSSLEHIPFGALLPPKELRVPAAPKAPTGSSKPSLGLRGPADDGNLDILPIPRSLHEIYAVSNKNRKKQSKVRCLCIQHPIRSLCHSRCSSPCSRVL
jgi:hypothetical protein